jgi:hypothetical protein
MVSSRGNLVMFSWKARFMSSVTCSGVIATSTIVARAGTVVVATIRIAMLINANHRNVACKSSSAGSDRGAVLYKSALGL